jgi:hypothetical protein
MYCPHRHSNAHRHRAWEWLERLEFAFLQVGNRTNFAFHHPESGQAFLLAREGENEKKKEMQGPSFLLLCMTGVFFSFAKFQISH